MLRICLLSALTIALAAPAAHAKAIFVTTSSDLVYFAGGCTLRDAVRSANDDIARGGCSAGQADDDIHFLLNIATLSITGKYDDLGLYGDLDVRDGSLTVHGAPGGTTINAQGVDRVFEADAPLTLEDLTIKGGRPGADGSLGVNVYKAWGGAVLARSDLTVRRVTFEDNATADGVGGVNSVGVGGGGGGAVAAMAGPPSSVSIIDSVFTNNRTGDGAPKPIGGSSAGGGGGGGALITFANPTTTITGSRFTGNRTGAGGGGGGASAYGGFGSAFDTTGTATNTIASGNIVGVGGSAAVRGATLRHVTVAGNSVDGVQGINQPSGVISADVIDSILAGSGTVCTAVDDLGGNVSPQGAGCPGAGSDPQLDASLIPAADSRAIDHATGTCPASDMRGVARPQGPGCDSGAIERRPTTLTFDPGVLVFGALLPGTLSGAQNVELTYAGDGALQLGAVTTTGDFAASGCTGTVLVDAGSCTVAVTFSPAAPGPRSGLLSLATPVGTRSVPLGGTGIALAPPATGTPAGDTPPGGSAADAAARASIRGASLRRRNGRLRLYVDLSCPAGRARCAESLRVRVTRPGRKALFASLAIALAPGARVSKSVGLPRGFARGLPPRARIGLRLRLVKGGRPVLERRLTRRVT